MLFCYKLHITFVISHQIIAEDAFADFISMASVTININDINDNFPEFEEDAYEFSVDEHCDDGMVVGTVTVSAYFIYSLFLFMVSMVD